MATLRLQVPKDRFPDGVHHLTTALGTFPVVEGAITLVEDEAEGARELLERLSEQFGLGEVKETGSTTTAPRAPTPAVKAHADALGVDVTAVSGTGKGGAVTKADVTAAAAASPRAADTPAQEA